MRSFLGTFIVVAVLFGLISHSSAQQLAGFESAGLKIQLSEDVSGIGDSAKIFRLRVLPSDLSTPLKDLTTAFVLEKPVRLVIDVSKFKADTSTAVRVNHDLLQQVRLGIHSDKIRLVVDIAGDKTPEFLVAPFDSGGVEISFNFGGQLHASEGKEEKSSFAASLYSNPTSEVPPKKEPEKKEAPKEEEIVKPEPEVAKLSVKADAPKEVTEEKPIKENAIVKVEEVEKIIVSKSKSPVIVSKAELPERSTTAVADDETKKVEEGEKLEIASLKSKPTETDPGKSLVTAINFEKASQDTSSSLVMKVNNLNQFSLLKKDSGLYRLLIENAALAGHHLELPQFPPDNFAGMEVVVAKQEGGKVEMDIYVYEGIRLTPFRTKDELRIRVAE